MGICGAGGKGGGGGIGADCVNRHVVEVVLESRYIRLCGWGFFLRAGYVIILGSNPIPHTRKSFILLSLLWRRVRFGKELIPLWLSEIDISCVISYFFFPPKTTRSRKNNSNFSLSLDISIIFGPMSRPLQIGNMFSRVLKRVQQVGRRYSTQKTTTAEPPRQGQSVLYPIHEISAPSPLAQS